MLSTAELLARCRAGEGEARETLCARFLPQLRRFARGRLPRAARGLVDTDDLVQETLLRCLHHVASFEPRGAGALAGYLRQAVVNRVRDEIRRAARRPQTSEDFAARLATSPSPLDEVIGREALERYERALARLKQDDRELLVARLELDCPYEDLAQALGRPSADAARVAVSRALVRLAQEMARDD